MKVNRSWSSVILAVFAVTMLACGSDGDSVVDDGSGGQAGSSSAGAAGEGAGGSPEAGAAGEGGGGTGGQAQGGEGGSAGGSSAGAGGTAGQAGAGGGTAGQGGAGAGGTAGQAGAGAGGTAGQAGSSACPQEASEPNDIESTAFDLKDSTDCDKDGGTIKGHLGPSDDDWYTWHAKDATGCLVDPTFTLKSAHNVTMCAFFLCDKGKTKVTCPSGSNSVQSVNGRFGCCTNASELKPKLECKGTSSEDAYLWLHVGWKDNTECFPYEIEYHQ